MQPDATKPNAATATLRNVRLHLESLTLSSTVLIMGETKGVVVSSTADEWDNDGPCAELPAVTVMYQDKAGKLHRQTFSPIEAFTALRLTE